MTNLSEIEVDDRKEISLSRVRRLTPFWYQNGIWIKVPGYKTYCTRLTDGEQKLLPESAICSLDVGV